MALRGRARTSGARATRTSVGDHRVLGEPRPIRPVETAGLSRAEARVDDTCRKDNHREPPVKKVNQVSRSTHFLSQAVGTRERKRVHMHPIRDVPIERSRMPQSGFVEAVGAAGTVLPPAAHGRLDQCRPAVDAGASATWGNLSRNRLSRSRNRHGAHQAVASVVPSNHQGHPFEGRGYPPTCTWSPSRGVG